MEPSSSHLSLRRPSHPSRRELQGRRPAALEVGKDSHKIRKQPGAAARRGPPVIIYTVSPKVIHATCGEFMSLVQRLTGAGPEKGKATGGGDEAKKRNEEGLSMAEYSEKN